MLYELIDEKSKLKPIPFQSMGLEKDLENLLITHLFDVVFQEPPLLPFHQEKSGQAVADIYALDQYGNMHIFELKRDMVGSDALAQLLRYVNNAGLWKFSDINKMYSAYSKESDLSCDLQVAHQEAFGLDIKLCKDDFNRRQYLWIVGSAVDNELVRRVDYWKSKGLLIDFLPYRIYDLGGKAYFEFFSKPYDKHLNPADCKGVLFDTNRSYDVQEHLCLKEMFEKDKVSAYGNSKDAVDCLQKNDLVFYTHGGVGIVGAARVKDSRAHEQTHIDHDIEKYLNVDIITPKSKSFESVPPAMSFGEVKSLLGHGFFWARTVKYPYLSKSESEMLLEELKKLLVEKDVEL